MNLLERLHLSKAGIKGEIRSLYTGLAARKPSIRRFYAMKPLALGLKPRQPFEGLFPRIRIGGTIKSPLGAGYEKLQLRKRQLFSLGLGIGAALEPAHFRFWRLHGFAFASVFSHFLACALTFFGAVPP